MNPYLVQVPIFVPLPVLLQAQATYLNMMQNSQQQGKPLETPVDTCLDKLEKRGVSAYSIISKAPEEIEKDLDEEERKQKEKEMEKEREKEVVAASVRKSKKVPKLWHLASHKFFRNAIYKQIFDYLHEPQLAVVLNRLNSVGCDVKKFALAIESKLYYSAERLEEYLEFTTLKKRVCEEIKKTKKVYI